MKLKSTRDENGKQLFPYKDSRNNCEYNRDLICLWLSEQGNWELKVNEELVSGNGYNELGVVLKELIKLKEKGHRKQSVRRLVIWTNRLGLFRNAIILAMNTEDLKEDNIKNFKQKMLISIKNDDIEFRNFDAIAGQKIERLQKNYRYNGSEVENMITYIKSQPQQNWTHFKWTSAHCFEALFYKRLNSELNEEQKNKIKYEIATRQNNEIYNEFIYKGGKAGIIWISKAAHRKEWKNIESWDISQAYGGQFVRAKDFPLGQIYTTKKPKEEVMKENWYAFAFEFDHKVAPPVEWIKIFPHGDKWYCLLTKPDFDAMQLMGARFNERPRIKYQFLCKNIGYLDYNVRRVINDIYTERQELKSKGDTSENFLKQMNEVIYGKGLQEREKNFRYFCPQISYHALAKTRYELILMISQISAPVACDSDCIKFCSTYSNDNRVFESRSKEIKAALKEAGFPDAKIGTWKHEGLYGRFIQFEKKVYAYEDEDGKLVCKFAGCNKESLNKWLENCGDMNGLLSSLKIPGGVVFKNLQFDLIGNFWVETKYLDYSLDKDELLAYQKRKKIICA